MGSKSKLGGTFYREGGYSCMSYIEALKKRIVRLSGFEPLTDGLEGHCSTTEL
tara:strand:- start:335 stop:493 length:159 start_codon:yes stop_codon:yes gene_type:complete